MFGALDITLQCKGGIRREEGEQGCPGDYIGVTSADFCMAAPSVCRGGGNQAGFDRVLDYVADDTEEFMGFRYKVALVTVSIDGAGSVVPAVVVETVITVEKPDYGGQGFTTDLDEKVVVVVHEGVLEEECIMGGQCCREETEKLLLVTGVLIDVVPVVAPLDYVVDGIRCIVPLPPGHVIKCLLPGATCHLSGTQFSLRVPCR